MKLQLSPSLPHAHQQIRLGDIQASVHKWTRAIEYYSHAIEYFKAIQDTLSDSSLISIIQAQIIQCEKSIHLCRLKDRTEQSIKDQQVERQSKLARTYSTSYLISSTKSNRMITRHHTFQIDHPVMFDDRIFSQTNETSPRRMRIIAKKNEKNDAHKIEELQMSYEALKTHLKVAFDDIERLKHENNQLRVQTSIHTIEEQNEPRLLTNSEEDESETELEATL